MNPPVLRSLRARLLGWLLVRTCLALLAALGLAAASFVLADALLDLSEPLRAAVPWLLGLGAFGLVLLALRYWRRLNDRRVARLFEQLDPALGDKLTNAVQLTQVTSPTPFHEFLRREAIELGRKAANTRKTWPVARRGVVFGFSVLAAVLCLWLLLVSSGSQMVQIVFPRFWDPSGDHPPYSKLQLHVLPGAADVLFGGQIEVRVQTAGRSVDKLWLVARSSTNSSRTVMFLSPDHSFFQTLANLREPTEYFVTDGQARSRRFSIGIRYTPQITLVEQQTIFPEYTGKPTHTGRLPEEPQALPEETRIGFRVSSNRPLRNGDVLLTPVLGGKPDHVELRPENNQGTVVTGAFILAGPVAFSLSVRDINGLESLEPRRGRFNISPDNRPTLFVTEPGRNAVATPRVQVPVKVEAQDDYGVARIVWLRGHNRSLERPFQMKLTLKGNARSVESTGAFALEELGVRPGDVIDYYFEAADNYPKGPNVALSRLYRLEIISEEQYQGILRQAAARKALFEPYFKLDGWLRRLAEQARGLEAKEKASDPATRRDAEELADQLETYERELGKLLQHPTMFDVEQSFRSTLVAQHNQVSAARQQLQQALKSGTPTTQLLKQLSEQLSRLSRAEEEQVGQPAQHISSVVQIVSRADTFVRLAQQQAMLAQMLARFADKTNALSRIEQVELQELAHQQHRVEESLQKLLAELKELLPKVPEEPAYEQLRRDVNAFLNAVAEAKIDSTLADASKALAQSDALTGHAFAQQAATKMARLIGRCNGMPEQGDQSLKARFQPKLVNPGLGNTLRQILAAMSTGNGQGGQDGYGLFNEDAALYGPNVELAGTQAGGRQDSEGANGRARSRAPVAGSFRDPALPPPETPGHVRLQPDAKFPLRYRDLVGDYFRAIAETVAEEGGKR